MDVGVNSCSSSCDLADGDMHGVEPASCPWAGICSRPKEKGKIQGHVWIHSKCWILKCFTPIRDANSSQLMRIFYWDSRQGGAEHPYINKIYLFPSLVHRWGGSLYTSGRGWSQWDPGEVDEVIRQVRKEGTSTSLPHCRNPIIIQFVELPD